MDPNNRTQPTHLSTRKVAPRPYNPPPPVQLPARTKVPRVLTLIKVYLSLWSNILIKTNFLIINRRPCREDRRTDRITVADLRYRYWPRGWHSTAWIDFAPACESRAHTHTHPNLIQNYAKFAGRMTSTFRRWLSDGTTWGLGLGRTNLSVILIVSAALRKLSLLGGFMVQFWLGRLKFASLSWRSWFQDWDTDGILRRSPVVGQVGELNISFVELYRACCVI